VSISIITVTYNAERYIKDCILSVQQQGIAVDHIIIDGQSTDSTLDILKEYNSSFKLVVSEPDKGIYDAMNKGISLVNDGIVGILNADDCYPDSDVLRKVSAVFEDPLVEACYGDLKYIDCLNSEKVVRYWKAGTYKPKKFLWGWMPPHPTFFVRKSVYDRYGVFDLDLGTAADYEIMLRFLLVNRINAVYLPETLVHMRVGGVSNVRISNRLKANTMDRKAWIVNNIKPYPWTLYFKPMRKILQWVRK